MCEKIRISWQILVILGISLCTCALYKRLEGEIRLEVENGGSLRRGEGGIALIYNLEIYLYKLKLHFLYYNF